MTDLHCHSLCNVDDGASSLDEMKEMLDIAYDDGIRSICFTPHFKHHHFKDTSEMDVYKKKVLRSFDMAKEYVSSKYDDMRVFLGNEIMYHHDVLESLGKGYCFGISSSSYVLVEFNPNTSFFDINTALSKLLRKGVRPILAHVERYSDLSKDLTRVSALKEIGVVIQVNSSSVTKFKIGKSARFVNALFKKGLVDIIATDAHSSVEFKPIMSAAVKKIEKKYGERVAKRVASINPAKILENEKLY